MSYICPNCHGLDGSHSGMDQCPPDPDAKRCSDCKEYKQISSFYKNKTRKDGYQNCCKDCLSDRMSVWYDLNKDDTLKRTNEYRALNKDQYAEYMRQWREKFPEKSTEQTRRSHLKTDYNLTLEDYNNLCELQQYRCLICGNIPDVLCIDHNHFTDKVRGLLCQKCNSGIGFFNDSLETIVSAFFYLMETDHG